jgi:hypothetical protein
MSNDFMITDKSVRRMKRPHMVFPAIKESKFQLYAFPFIRRGRTRLPDALVMLTQEPSRKIQVSILGHARLSFSGSDCLNLFHLVLLFIDGDLGIFLDPVEIITLF